MLCSRQSPAWVWEAFGCTHSNLKPSTARHWTHCSTSILPHRKDACSCGRITGRWVVRGSLGRVVCCDRGDCTSRYEDNKLVFCPSHLLATNVRQPAARAKLAGHEQHRAQRREEAEGAKWRRLAAQQPTGCHSSGAPKRPEQRGARRQGRWLRGLAREVEGMSRFPHSNAYLFQCRRRQGGGGHGAAPAAACAVSWGDERRINGELSRARGAGHCRRPESSWRR